MCKCRALPDRGDGDGIEYCSMHAAAPRMLDMLRHVADAGNKHNHAWLCDHAPDLIRAILRDVEGESNG